MIGIDHHALGLPRPTRAYKTSTDYVFCFAGLTRYRVASARNSTFDRAAASGRPRCPLGDKTAYISCPALGTAIVSILDMWDHQLVTVMRATLG